MLYRKLYELYEAYVNTLKSLPHRPESWLPHIVYVEEEGDYPIYTRYLITEIRSDGGCTLINDETGAVFTDRHLLEIDIDWLDTLLSWYYDCCNEQGLTIFNEGNYEQ